MCRRDKRWVAVGARGVSEAPPWEKGEKRGDARAPFLLCPARFPFCKRPMDLCRHSPLETPQLHFITHYTAMAIWNGGVP